MCVIVAAAGFGMAAASSQGGERVVYDRQAAVAYANAWALGNNPDYWASPDSDCANFVSQCVAAGGLRPFADPAGEWAPNGTDFPSVAWVNCEAQLPAWSSTSAMHTPYIVQTSRSRPREWAAGDVVYLGNIVAGVPRWEHVVICVGKGDGRWLYSAHTTAHKRKPIRTWYPAHFSLIRYCHMSDAVTYE